jgi:Nucleoside-diphosphate-sugar pyrophosphorylase involved in lipopolysaccharide biosynthesis/translation initiation factor 2B, gamma/epsilon subunits (eIF-2Bgamma/eIF-2Bepsilon)
MLTYGDGVADVNLKKLLNFHKKHKKIASMTVVRPPVRFGEVKIKRNLIYEFKEKPQIKKSWINGGFFIFNSKIFKYLKSYNEMLENKPLEKLSKNKQLMAFKHSGFWQCMDTNRDKELLQKLLKSGKAPWLN